MSLEATCGEEENDKKAELQNLLVDQELTNQLAEKSSWVDQLQENLLENDDQQAAWWQQEVTKEELSELDLWEACCPPA